MATSNDLYKGKTNRFFNRKKKLDEEFFRFFSTAPEHYFSSPGRIEILGNHTDHQNGKVLVSAIDLDILAAAKKTDDNKIIINSLEYGVCEVDITDLQVKAEEFSTSTSLIRGVVKGLFNKGYKIGGFISTITSNIFQGAGLSSSAAYELLVAEILNQFYNEGKIDRLTLAKVAQFSENVYFNKPCGLLDQCGISFGGINYIDFKDLDNPHVNTLDNFLKNYRIVLTNTGGSHAGLTKYYASIKDDLKKVCAFFGKNVLREVDEPLFYANLPTLLKKVGGRAINRAIHVYNENSRVFVGYKALENNDEISFIRAVNQSGQSSFDLLQNCFIEKDKRQGIALALNLSKIILLEGGVRVHGGGFKGTIIAFVPTQYQLSYIKHMKEIFGKRNVVKVSFRKEGTTIIE